MTALYTTSTWDNVDGGVHDIATTARHQHNREPWDARWSLASTSQTRDCPAARAAVHAEFGSRAVFDLTDDWYANIHDSAVQLNGDGTALYRLDVTLRHTFIGWHWVRSCS